MSSHRLCDPLIGVVAVAAFVLMGTSPVGAFDCGVQGKTGDGARALRGEFDTSQSWEGYVLGTVTSVEPDPLGYRRRGADIELEVAAATRADLGSTVKFRDLETSNNGFGFHEGRSYFVTLLRGEVRFTQLCSYTYEVSEAEFDEILAVARELALPATDTSESEPWPPHGITGAYSLASIIGLLISTRLWRPGTRQDRA